MYESQMRKAARRQTALCVRCGIVRYCDANCQKLAWCAEFLPHKHLCTSIHVSTLSSSRNGGLRRLGASGVITPHRKRWISPTFTSLERWRQSWR
ncbi:hypothetical protein B0H19DRAFT_1162086 [Mycena capillaripes]|nr:hypothetical protein B0H19DRAFT_1162086 [Mycena capillaripes]